MAQSRKRHAPLITALEPRMLLDGAALTEASQAITDTELQQAAPPPTDTTPADAPADDTNVTGLPPAPVDPAFALSEDPAGQVIVVDASVPFADHPSSTVNGVSY